MMREGKCLGASLSLNCCYYKYTDVRDVPHTERKLRQNVILTKLMILS